MSEIKNSFGLPEDYFNVSSRAIFNKIEWQDEHKEFPNLLKYRNVEVFDLPPNYLETNEGKLELLAYNKINLLQKQNSFLVPLNYFEENEGRLFSLTESEVKIIPLFSKKMWYAAAAIILVTLGFWFYAAYFNPTNPSQDCNTLACIEKKDLLKAKTLETLDNEDLYDMVDLQKLEQNLNSTSTNEDFED